MQLRLFQKAVFLQEGHIACQIPFSLNNGAHTPPRKRIKGLCLRKDEPFLPGFFHNGNGKRMLAAGFHSRRFRQEFLPGVLFIPQDHIRYRRMPYRDCSCLIQHYRIDGMQGFQAHRRFYEDAVFRRFSRSHHNCHRRGKAQGTGTGYYQHRNGVGKGKFKGLARYQPYYGCQYGNDNNRRDKNPAHPVGKACDRSLGISRLIHQTNDLSQCGVISYSGGTEKETAVFVNRCRYNIVSRFLLHRDALSGNSRLIHITVAFRYHAVHGNASARLDYHDIACRHIFCGNHLFDAVPQDNRRLRGQIHQLTERVGGLCLGSRFQILSYGDQCQYHGTGLEIQFMTILMHQIHVPMAEAVGHPIHGKHAIYKSCRGSYRHQGIHVGRFFHQRLKTGLVKMAIDDHYRNS